MSTDDYTPHPDHVRAAYARITRIEHDRSWDSGAAEFDAFLAEHDRQTAEDRRVTAEKAWDEGHRTPQARGDDGCMCGAWNEDECGCGKYGTGPIITPNPYRKVADDE